MSEATAATGAATPEEMRALIVQLTKRIDSLEAKVEELTREKPIPEDVLIAIGAAVSAYLGNKGKVRAVRLSTSSGWSAEERAVIHNRAVPRR